MSEKIPEIELLSDLNEVSEYLNKTPTWEEYNQHGKFSSRTIYNNFGKWNKALRIAGLKDRISDSGRHYIRSQTNALAKIPPPNEQWTYHNVSEVIQQRLQKLLSEKIVVVIGKNDDGHKLYRVNAKAYELIEKHSQEIQRLPCGHTGIKNIGDGLFTCGFDGCSRKYTRDTMQLLLES